MDGEHSRGRLQGWIVCLCMEYDRQIPPGLAQPLHDCRYEKSPEEVASLPFAHYSVHYSNIVVGGGMPRTECLVMDTAARNEVTERRSPRSGEVVCETQN